jgi:ADP-ribose pyrophosphatase YjhB (NUDIX family)
MLLESPMTTTGTQPDPTPAVRVVARALLLAGERIVLVREAYQDMTLWLAPGGAVEPGELITDALVREIREETRLDIGSVGRLAFCVNTRRAHTTTLVMFFEVTDWSGTPHPGDPDILDVTLATREQALRLLAFEPRAPRRITVPVVDYLRGDNPVGTVWTWTSSDPTATGEVTPPR